MSDSLLETGGGSIPRVPSKRFLVNKVDDEVDTPTNVADRSDENALISPSRQVHFFQTDDTLHNESTFNGGTLPRMSMATERLPNIDNYRNRDSIAGTAATRPTLMDLHKPSERKWESRYGRGSIFGKRASASPISKKQSNQIKFGWIQGVLVRCILNILGVMLYLRLSWVAGQAGILLGSSIVILGSVVTTVTALSMSAISTNGDIKGGGAYFMISRSLGPEFGGSIGIIFTIANNVGAAMYIVGFAETVRDLMKENGAVIIDGGQNDVRIISWATAVLLIAVVVAGVSFEAKAQLVLLVILVVSMVNYFVGTFIPPSVENQAKGITGYSSSTFLENLLPNWRAEGFFSVFAVYFPAATGIMAGANISGDLADPQKAIPKGTLLAILITTILYVGGVFLTGSTCLRDASGLVEDLVNGSITDCATNGTGCDYGLLNFYQIMEMESAWGPLITAGIFAATLSSALASLVSAPKILQAVGRDRLFPFLEFFSVGYGKSDEPRRGYALTFVICLGVIAIGDLNAIAPIISNFFLASYGLVNYACFDASFSESLGFRPSFKYYNKWISLFGAFLCVGVMFVISWWTALITFAFILILYVYIARRKPDVNWGSSTQAASYKSALKKLQKLQSIEEHVKNYRPQILLLTGTPNARPSLIDFVANITKDNSLLICGDVILAETSYSSLTNVNTLSKQVTAWLMKRKIKAFYNPVLSDSLPNGVQCLLQAGGLSKLKANILFFGYKSNWYTCERQELADYFQTIHSGFEFNLGVGIFRDKEGFDISTSEEVDVDPLDMTDYLESPEPMSPPIDDEDRDEKEPLEKVGAENEKQDVKITIEPELQKLTEGMDEANRSLDRRRASVRYFHKKVKKATIDVWWLYDDGGLTLLVPHLLRLNKSFLEGANMRIFTVASSKSRLEHEQRSMAALLSKFRIDYKEVFVIPEIASKPSDKTLLMFDDLIKPFVRADDDEDEEDAEQNVFTSEAELLGCRMKTHRHLRTRELLLERSSDASLIVLTLPVPRTGAVSASLYMAWLEMMSRDLPPMLFLRGNQQSVLTFYS